ncbi:Zyx [Drosophila busckii]|uniref:Zyx n=1 Tax=Drosophila busckii TaxID=30019 RepID=A0A0M4EWU2_DROBS|nr:Zyx [Drosophila busckii]
MNNLNEQLRQLTILSNTSNSDRYVKPGKVAALVNSLQQKANNTNDKDISSVSTPSIPPKPLKSSIPQVPLSKQISREPLYSRPLSGCDLVGSKTPARGVGAVLMRKQPIYSDQCGDSPITSQTTLDNPAVLEQQLEALAYHKLQLEKKGLLGNGTGTEVMSTIPRLSSTSLSSCASQNTSMPISCNAGSHQNDEFIRNNTAYGYYSNVKKKDLEDDLPPPPSPVSSSYSELHRASNGFNKRIEFLENLSSKDRSAKMSHKNYENQFADQTISEKDFHGKRGAEYCGYGELSQSSSTYYDSIYEPINPRPPSCLSRANYNMYASYVNEIPTAIGENTSIYCNDNALAGGKVDHSRTNLTKGIEGDGSVGQFQLNSIDTTNEVDTYGRCSKCGERVLGENSGCTAMDQIYHISCFTCSQCQANLQGKPFYALDGKPFCEYDYLQTLEKCSVCLKPILERILRATGKPYHPQCFTCVVCGNSLDAIPFTVDATNQNYCIADFHKKFAPRCCVCKDPIMPDPGQEETVRVVALDRSFHLECYKCEDCGLLLSSEADGRGCYPLDDHVLCKGCNARRVQVLTSRMTSQP